MAGILTFNYIMKIPHVAVATHGDSISKLMFLTKFIVLRIHQPSDHSLSLVLPNFDTQIQNNCMRKCNPKQIICTYTCDLVYVILKTSNGSRLHII